MMFDACIIGVVGFGTDNPPLEIRALQWGYNSEDECLVLALLGTDCQTVVDMVSLTNVIPKEFVLKVTHNKRKLQKVRDTHIVEKRLHERNLALMELAQYFSDADKKTWNAKELIKICQAREM